MRRKGQRGCDPIAEKSVIKEFLVKLGVDDEATQKLDAFFQKGEDGTSAFERSIKSFSEKAQDSLSRVEGGFDDLASSSADSADGMEKAAKSTDKAGDSAKKTNPALKKMAEGFQKLGTAATKGAQLAVKGLGQIAKGVSVAAGAMGTAMGAMAVSAANAGDEVDKMSQKFGMSRKGYQEWNYILSQNGASIETMQTGMKTLQNHMTASGATAGATAQMFSKIGLSFAEIQKMDPEQAFEATVAALQGMEEGAEKNALAMKLLGNSGQQLIPLLNQAAGSTDVLKKQAEMLGLVMSDQAVDAAVEFTDALDNTKRMIGGIKNSIGADFLPFMTQGLQAFMGFAGGAEHAPEQLERAIDGFIGMVAEKVPRFVEKGSEILQSLLKGITQAAPKLIQELTNMLPLILTAVMAFAPDLLVAAADVLEIVAQGLAEAIPVLIPEIVKIIPLIVSTITGMAPNLLKAGIEIIVALIEGIAKSAPDLVPAAVDAVLTLVGALLNNVGLLVNAAITLMIGLANGLIAALPVLLEKAPEIIQQLVAAIVENVPLLLEAAAQLIVMLVTGLVESFPKLVEVGVNAVKSIWEGIKSMGSWIKDKVGGFFSGAFGGIKDFFTGGGNGSPDTPLAVNHDGNIITQEGTTRIAEGNKPEMIVPLTKPGRARQLMRQAEGFLGGGDDLSGILQRLGNGIDNLGVAIENFKATANQGAALAAATSGAGVVNNYDNRQYDLSRSTKVVTSSDKPEAVAKAVGLEDRSQQMTIRNMKDVIV